MKVKGLGRGLSSLLGEEIASSSEKAIVQIININLIEANSNQPRKKFEYDKIKELADSIINNGLLQPIIVSSVNEGIYKIIAGERRWRACKLAKLMNIPVIIKDCTSQEAMEMALIENIQREELTPIEEAEGLNYLIQELNYTQEQLAEKLSKSRSHISNLLRLNHLPQSIKNKVNDKLLSMGHARCLINHEHAETIADHIVEHDLSVRQTEQIVKNWSKDEYIKSPNNGSKSTKQFLKENTNDLQLLAKALSEKFNIKITIEDYSIGGRLILHYSNMEELDSILVRLN